MDRTTGYVYMVLSDHGLWLSNDQGATFERVDSGKVTGRCETGFAPDVDPNGKRVTCNMVQGSSGIVLDSGASAGKSRATHFDCGATDWSDGRTLLAIWHESGGTACVSHDGGVTWKDIGMGFKRIGVFDAKAFVATRAAQPGILRSEDAGATWRKVSDLVPTGLTMKVFKGVGYWTSSGGLLVSKDKGATWAAGPHTCRRRARGALQRWSRLAPMGRAWPASPAPADREPAAPGPGHPGGHPLPATHGR